MMWKSKDDTKEPSPRDPPVTGDTGGRFFS